MRTDAGSAGSERRLSASAETSSRADRPVVILDFGQKHWLHAVTAPICRDVMPLTSGPQQTEQERRLSLSALVVFAALSPRADNHSVNPAMVCCITLRGILNLDNSFIRQHLVGRVHFSRPTADFRQPGDIGDLAAHETGRKKN